MKVCFQTNSPAGVARLWTPADQGGLRGGRDHPLSSQRHGVRGGDGREPGLLPDVLARGGVP